MRVSAWILGAAMLAAPQAMAQESAPATPSAAKPAVNVNAPRPAMSDEQLVAMRNTLAARIGVYDAVEKTWREPTPSEQAALLDGLAATGASRVVTLPNGATAMKAGADGLSFLTVEVQPDGTLKMGHAAGADAAHAATVPTPRLKKAVSEKGGRNAE